MIWRISIFGVLTLAMCLSAMTDKTAKAQGNSRNSSSPVPQLIDPGFESFSFANAPISGWYSDDLDPSNPGFGFVKMTPDPTVRVEGEYSLRIEQPRRRPPGRGLAFLSQAVRMPAEDHAPRRFDLSVQVCGINGPLKIEVYVWEPTHVARVIASRDVSVSKIWKDAKLTFSVPRGYDSFGIWFYLPPNEETQLWLDDVRLGPATK